MVTPLIPKNKEFAKFQYSVFRRAKKWTIKCGIKCSDVQYAPYLKKGTEDSDSYRPDIVFDIYRNPNDLLLPEVIINSFDRPILMDGAMQDWLDYYIQQKKDIVIRVILDATLWDFRDPDKWNKRLKKTKEYAQSSLRNDDVHYAVAAIVSPTGWDSSVEHAVEGKTHIISFDYLDRYLDFILVISDYEHMNDAMDDFLFMKQEECEHCSSNEWRYIPIYGCNEYGLLIEDVIEDWTDAFRDGGALIKEIKLCSSCSWRHQGCDGFDRFFFFAVF